MRTTRPARPVPRVAWPLAAVACLALALPAPGPRGGAVLAGPGAPDPAVEAGDEEGPLVPEGDDPDLILVYTGRVRGYVEPCGCPRNPAGGLARRAGYLELLEKAYPRARVVLIETGEFAAEFDEPGRLKTSTYVKGLQEFGYDVVGVGERELAGGLDAFREILEDADLPLVSASWTGRGSDELLVDPYLVKEFKPRRGKKIKIGFLGLTTFNSRFASLGGDGSAVVPRDPVAQARRYLPELAERADLVVLLANLSSRDIRRVVQAAPGTVDLVLAAFSDRLSPRAMEEIEGIPTFYAGDQGRRLGEVRLFLKKGAVERMTAHLIHLTSRYPSDSSYQRKVDAMLAKVNELMKEQAVAAAATGSAPAAAAGEPREEYLGSSRCLACHEDAFRVWQHSRHARALQTLVNANQDYNPDCVRCHTTGYGKPAGFVSAKATPTLANVQCEACHGPGSPHLRDSSAPYGTVPPRACFACHTRENSPEFSFFKYWNTIRH